MKTYVYNAEPAQQKRIQKKVSRKKIKNPTVLKSGGLALTSRNVIQFAIYSI